MNFRILKEIVTQRRRQLIVLVALLLFGVGLYLVRTLFVQDTLVEARTEWAKQRMQMKQRTQLGKAEQFDLGMRDYAQFTARIPVKKDFARVIGELFEIAGNNSLSVGSVTYKPVNNPLGYLEYKINIDVTGTYGGIKSFLSDISQAKEIISVDSIDLSKSGKMFEEEVTLRATLTILFGQEG